MSIWPPPPRRELPAPADSRLDQWAAWSLGLALTGTLLGLASLMTNRGVYDAMPGMWAGWERFQSLSLLVVSPCLLTAALVLGIKARQRPLGLVGLAWAILGLVLLGFAILLPIFAHARERA